MWLLIPVFAGVRSENFLSCTFSSVHGSSEDSQLCSRRALRALPPTRRGFRNQGNQRLYKEDLAGQAHASFCRRTEFSWQSLFLSQISVTLHRLRFAFRPRKGVFMQLKGKRVGIPHNPVAVCLSESAVCAFAMSLEDNVSPYLRV